MRQARLRRAGGTADLHANERAEAGHARQAGDARARGECDVNASGRVAAMAVVLASIAAHGAAAQSDTTYDSFWGHPIHAAAFVGGSFPTGQWRNYFDAAYDGGTSVAWPATAGIWLEGLFNGQAQLMNNNTVSSFQATGGGAWIFSLTGNVVANAPNWIAGVTPYIVAGGGGYSRLVQVDDYATNTACNPFLGFCGAYGPTANHSRTQNVPGWNAGAGVRFRVTSFRLYVEARYNTAYTRYSTTTFVPIVVGAAW
jgi:hypothetical protein